MNLFAPHYNFLRPAYWLGEVDARPLSLFRIFFAALLIKNVIFLLPVAATFYSDEGVLPRQTLWKIAPRSHFSLMDAMPHPWMAQFFLGLWLLVLVCLLIGYQTRLMTCLNFILLLSVFERNVVILSGPDSTMRVLSFWALFIPLGKVYAVDALRQRWHTFRITRNVAHLRPPVSPPTIFALPVRLIQIQIALIYIFTFILKLSGRPWRNGTALYYALQLESLTLPSGTWLMEHAPLWMLKAGTYFTLFAEGGFVFFVFLPFIQPALRAFGLLLVTMLHLGIAVLMAIPDFSLVMMISFLTFWDGQWITWMDQKWRGQLTHWRLPLPAENSPLWLIVALIPASLMELIPSDSPSDMAADQWHMLDQNDQIYQGAAAWKKMAALLPFSAGWKWLLSFQLVRRMLWALGCWVLRYPVIEPRLDAQITAGRSYPFLVRIERAALTIPLLLLMGIVIWLNLGSVERDGKPLTPPLPPTLAKVIRYINLKQDWGMFAPYPIEKDGWITIPGQFEDGRELDLMTGKPLSDSMTHYYWGPDVRWSNYSVSIWTAQPSSLIAAWAAYYCHLYNDNNALPPGKRLANIELYFNWRWSHPPGDTRNNLNRSRLGRHQC